MLTISRLFIVAGTCLYVFCEQCQAQTTKSVRERALWARRAVVC